MKIIQNKNRVLLYRLFFGIGLFLCLRCSTTPKHISEPISQSTDRNAISFDYQLIPTKLVSSPKLLPLYQISRKRVELRVGPGLEFPISNEFLSLGDMVISTYTYRYWNKVVHLESGRSGWIHKKTAQPLTKEEAVTLDSAFLANGFTIKNLYSILDYKNKEPIKAHLKKGQILKVLNTTSSHSLIYIPSNNSVAWIERRYIK